MNGTCFVAFLLDFIIIKNYSIAFFLLDCFIFFKTNYQYFSMPLISKIPNNINRVGFDKFM